MRKRPNDQDLPLDERVTRLLATHHSVAADRQLRVLGLSWGRQERRIASGRWTPYAPGVISVISVFSVVGSPDRWEQRAMAATLSCAGLALLSGAAAAQLHRLDGFTNVDTVEIVVPQGAHDRTADGVNVRWSRLVSTLDRHVIAGIPVTILPVTLIHLAADGLNAAQAFDAALRRRMSPLWFKEHFERWQREGVSGPTTMLRLLDERMGKRLPRSWFQRLAKAALGDHGEVLVDEWTVYDTNGKRLGDLDVAHVGLKVGVECQSIEFHATAADVAADVRRKRRMRAIGWDIVDLWWSDLDRPAEVLAELIAALDRARRLAL